MIAPLAPGAAASMAQRQGPVQRRSAARVYVCAFLGSPSTGAPGLISAVFSRWALETGYLRDYSRDVLAGNDRMHNTQTYAHRTLI